MRSDCITLLGMAKKKKTELNKEKYWICPFCDNPVTAGIVCSGCVTWVHYKCADTTYKEVVHQPTNSDI